MGGRVGSLAKKALWKRERSVEALFWGPPSTTLSALLPLEGSSSSSSPNIGESAQAIFTSATLKLKIAYDYPLMSGYFVVAKGQQICQRECCALRSAAAGGSFLFTSAT